MTSSLSHLKIFQLLKPALGEQAAEGLVDYIDMQITDNMEVATKILATKEDIAKLETKIAETKIDMTRWVFSTFIVMMLAIIGLYFKK